MGRLLFLINLKKNNIIIVFIFFNFIIICCCSYYMVCCYNIRMCVWCCWWAAPGGRSGQAASRARQRSSDAGREEDGRANGVPSQGGGVGWWEGGRLCGPDVTGFRRQLQPPCRYGAFQVFARNLLKMLVHKKSKWNHQRYLQTGGRSSTWLPPRRNL